MAAMARWGRGLRRDGVCIGLVPTMGALHAGHRSLIRKARLSCDAVVVSLFVNPAQFGPHEDFAGYPRPFSKDRALCEAEGVDVLFSPAVEAMYPTNFQTTVTVPDLARRWEGAARPQHFQGVATVVTKLFNAVTPDAAFFGQKDYQQAVLIRQMAQDLNFGVRVVMLATVREPDGLALSSRNIYLKPNERRAAPALYRALHAGAQAVRHGTRSARSVERVMQRTLALEPAVRLDYLAVCDARTLAPITQLRGPLVLLGAVRLGPVRLIDNMLVNAPAGS